MNCPECGADTQVIDSRISEGKSGNCLGPHNMQSVRRRRRCPNGHRFSTYESPVDEGWAVQVDYLESRLDVVTKFLLARVAESEPDEWESLRLMLGHTQEQLAEHMRVSKRHFYGIVAEGHGYSAGAASDIRETLKLLAKEKLTKPNGPDLSRCATEQAGAAELLRAGHPDERGLRQCINDNLAEEAIIRQESGE